MAQNDNFQRSEIVRKLSAENRFQLNEVGMNHSKTDSYIRLGDDGVIEIYAGEGTGIFMNPNTKTITFVADKVNFVTNKEDGIRWNDQQFNSQATIFTEPALVPSDSDLENSEYRDLFNYIQGVTDA